MKHDEEIWFTSDDHFYHSKKDGTGGVLEYCPNRPYETIEEMNEGLIKNWNDSISPGGKVFILGDFFFCNVTKAIEITKRLNGQKYWIFGNHDERLRKKKELNNLFEWCGDYKELMIEDPRGTFRGQKRNKIVLFHYPIASWNGMHKGSFMLHGHSHNSFSIDYGKIVDVGVDKWDMKPVSYNQIVEYMETREFRAVDGHGLKKEKQ